MNGNLKAKHPFWLKTGKPLHTLKDLHDELKIMPAEVFMHHVTSTKNDFASWVEHSLGHPTLAAQLKNANILKHEQLIGNEVLPKSMPAQKIERLVEPAIVVSKNKTMLSLRESPHPIVSKNKTQLHLHHEPHRTFSPFHTPLEIAHHYERYFSGYKTLLTLAHPKQDSRHHQGIAIVSYLSLGLVFGAGLVILLLSI